MDGHLRLFGNAFLSVLRFCLGMSPHDLFHSLSTGKFLRNVSF